MSALVMSVVPVAGDSPTGASTMQWVTTHTSSPLANVGAVSCRADGHASVGDLCRGG